MIKPTTLLLMCVAWGQCRETYGPSLAQKCFDSDIKRAKLYTILGDDWTVFVLRLHMNSKDSINHVKREQRRNSLLLLTDGLSTVPWVAMTAPWSSLSSGRGELTPPLL